jgi:hypothetical protein
MTPAERDAFLTTQPVCRVGTIGRGGRPHVSPLWFVWDGVAIWLYSIVRSQRWTDIAADPRVSVVVDDGGKNFGELRGVELSGRVAVVGEVPRTGEIYPELEAPERMFGAKYGPMRHDARHAWLRLVSEKVVSWDFRKLRRDG